MKNKILIVLGDPNSINSEIFFKVWKKIKTIDKERIFLIGNYRLIKSQFRKLKFSSKLIKLNNLNQKLKSNKIKIIDVKLEFQNPFKVNYKQASVYVKKSLNLAHSLGEKREILGIINCAINKTLLSNKNIGVTEYLAKKCNLKRNSEVMLIGNDKLFVCPITTHLNLKDVSRKINKKIIIHKVKLINSFYKKIYKIKPRIGILGLNPHNAELRNNSEEIKEIFPAVKHLISKGIKINGPLVSDTIFINDYKKYDVIVGMYHDQVLAPFKTLYKFNAINITLGLSYLRVTPDHGTAVDLILKNKANPESLERCVKYLKKFKNEVS